MSACQPSMSLTRKMPVVLAYSLLPAMGAVVVGMDAEAVVADAVAAMGVRRVAAAMAAEGVGVGAAAGVVVAVADAEAAVVAVCGSRVFVSVRCPVGAEIAQRSSPMTHIAQGRNGANL